MVPTKAFSIITLIAFLSTPVAHKHIFNRAGKTTYPIQETEAVVVVVRRGNGGILVLGFF